MKSRLIYMFVIFAALFIICDRVFSADVKLTWKANSESDLAGYKLYYGTESGTYPNVKDVGNIVQHILPNLEEGKTFYFALTAYDTSDNESGFSTELVYTVPIPTPIPTSTPDVKPPSVPQNFRFIIEGTININGSVSINLKEEPVTFEEINTTKVNLEPGGFLERLFRKK